MGGPAAQIRWSRAYIRERYGDVPDDAVTMERAAEIIAERSTKPNSVATRAMVRVLRRQAEVIRRERDHG